MYKTNRFFSLKPFQGFTALPASLPPEQRLPGEAVREV